MAQHRPIFSACAPVPSLRPRRRAAGRGLGRPGLRPERTAGPHRITPPKPTAASFANRAKCESTSPVCACSTRTLAVSLPFLIAFVDALRHDADAITIARFRCPFRRRPERTTFMQERWLSVDEIAAPLGIPRVRSGRLGQGRQGGPDHSGKMNRGGSTTRLPRVHPRNLAVEQFAGTQVWAAPVLDSTLHQLLAA